MLSNLYKRAHANILHQEQASADTQQTLTSFLKPTEKHDQNVARQVLSIPLSSPPVKTLSNIAGKVFTPKRCRLTDARFQEPMFIRCNN